jgi:formamidopyrimidine-DNA glycosylase
VVDNDTPLEKHDHFELVFTNGKRLRLNDPRRFGAVLFSENGSHPLLDNFHLNRATHTQMNNQCAYLKLNQQILASALYFIDTLI